MRLGPWDVMLCVTEPEPHNNSGEVEALRASRVARDGEAVPSECSLFTSDDNPPSSTESVSPSPFERRVEILRGTKNDREGI